MSVGDFLLFRRRYDLTFDLLMSKLQRPINVSIENMFTKLKLSCYFVIGRFVFELYETWLGVVVVLSFFTVRPHSWQCRGL